MPATQKKTGTGKAKPTSAKGKAAPKSGSQSTTKRKTKPPKKPPIYREVGAVICLLLAIFSALGYFNSQAIFINGLATLEKGLFGFGFWLMPVMLLLISSFATSDAPCGCRLCSACWCPSLWALPSIRLCARGITP